VRNVLTRRARSASTPAPAELDIAPAPLAWIRDRAADGFVLDLRRFVLSRGLAAIATGSGPIDVSPTGALHTRPEELMEWNGWSRAGRAFVETLRPGESLELALAPYPLLVTRFMDWLRRWQAAVHRHILDELADIQRGFTGTGAPRGSDPGVDEATLPASWLHEPHVADAS